MLAILLIDHGSRKSESNEQLSQMARLVEEMAPAGTRVFAAHMELAEPDVATGFASCVEAGATEVVAVPYMLAKGRHAAEDIPRLVQEAAASHPGIATRITEPLGVHPGLGAVVLARVNETA
jgi:sirohydrochlorin ferrochelatase